MCKSDYKRGHCKQPGKQDKQLSELRPFFCFLLNLLKEMDICKIDPFIFPEIKKMYQDWYCQCSKCKQEKWVDKLHVQR